ncbi:14-3-3 protein 8 [Tritrichomonas foetus]|uniref:14-3-3 protein 8 n=1 Tax=Tritrichomonas foetus TaxID=1144522 RepID=A0A1J4K3Q8_9EUKA|nr:14-3-3 protein 8 [Tritrichomonas foetus]|eukprot:OHT05472.1 14-3-3 protein 8 [Tritrichomonas foetus]
MSGKSSGLSTPLTPSSQVKNLEAAWECAQIAFQAKRYNECIRFFNEIIREQPRISKEQRELLSSSYKKSMQSSWNALTEVNLSLSLYKNPDNEPDIDIIKRLEFLQKTLQDEVRRYCNNFLELIDTTLLPVSSDVTAIVYYNKLKGDYYRYLSEVIEDDSEGNAGRSKSCYEIGLITAGEEMRIADPIYLSLVLNFSIFQYEILDMKDDAIDRADNVFNEAVRYMEELDEEEYSKASMILQLIRDNISIWSNERTHEQTFASESK